MIKKIIRTNKAPKAIGAYSQAIVANGFLFPTVQMPIHPETGEVPSTIEEQTVQVLDNLKAIIEEAGASLENVVKVTIYLQNLDYFDTVNKIYASYFNDNPPARGCFEIPRMAKNALVEIDAIVALDN
jgi:2-iminobutanoate/2-iminopropanoate deaminase